MKRDRIAYIISELVKRNGEADLKEFMGSHIVTTFANALLNNLKGKLA
jgi:hypothetical protein